MKNSTRPRVPVFVAIGASLLLAGCSTSAAPRDPAPGVPSSPAPAATAGNECDGATINRSASITSAHDLLVDAPVDRVWGLLTDVEGWSDWQQAVTSIERVDSGALAAESQFIWTTPVPESQLSPADTLTITSTVQQVDPGNCLLWQGPAIGESIQIDEGIHLWTFTEVEGGTLVHTEESWDAPVLSALEGADAEAAEGMLGGGLEAWLENLKVTAEAA